MRVGFLLCRWFERMAVVEAAQKHFNLKPTLPDFYNILLERPRHDPLGYGVAGSKPSHDLRRGRRY